jgi:hypothetical protein
MSEKRAFKGVWIPASLWNRTDISWFEKALVAEIDALSSEEDGPCFASLEFLAERMDSTPKSISNILSKLQLLGVVKRLFSDGRRTFRCVCPDYSSDPHQSHKWILDGFHPGVESEPTPALTQLQLGGGPENTSIDTSKDLSLLTRAHVRARPDSEEAVISYAGDLGLPESDGKYMWNHWLANGFTNGGKLVRDWKATMRTWQAGGFFPSQKHSNRSGQLALSNGNGHWEAPTKEQVIAYADSKGWTRTHAIRCWNHLVAHGWKYYGNQISTDEQLACAMADMLNS